MANVLNFRTLYYILFCFLCSCFLKILSGMANSVDPDQTAPSGLIRVITVCMCHFVRQFGVQNFRTFTALTLSTYIRITPYDT